MENKNKNDYETVEESYRTYVNGIKDDDVRENMEKVISILFKLYVLRAEFKDVIEFLDCKPHEDVSELTQIMKRGLNHTLNSTNPLYECLISVLETHNA